LLYMYISLSLSPLTLLPPFLFQQAAYGRQQQQQQ